MNIIASTRGQRVCLLDCRPATFSSTSCRRTVGRSIVSPRRHGGARVDKRKRHAVILELVSNQSVGSTEELRVLFHKRGWDVTQSTLSRDLRELRLARVPTPEGVRYTIADGTIS